MLQASELHAAGACSACLSALELACVEQLLLLLLGQLVLWLKQPLPLLGQLIVLLLKQLLLFLGQLVLVLSEQLALEIQTFPFFVLFFKCKGGVELGIMEMCN